MPKRQNPWGDSSPLQLKSHIGLKEIDISDSDRMESVYEKTKSLLFMGASKQFDIHGCEEVSGDSDFQFPRDHPVEILRGQMRLDVQGHLYSDVSNDSINMPRHPPSPASTMDSDSLDTGIMDTANFSTHTMHTEMSLLPGQLTFGPMGKLQPACSKGNVSPRKAVAFKVCHMCNQCNMSRLSRCVTCERDTCIGCLTQCCQCDSFVCKICSRVNYEDYLERSVCYLCAS